jgi:UDP-N-acetylmuramoyl-L-alanyl-D-glutamate--2,6-diaminopimelate ligase
MEKIKYKNNVIVIDYAHTPDAVLNILTTFKEISKKRMIVVIGCGGNRDKQKRPIMANITCRYADEVIFTSDNPRKESVETIIKDMISGLEYNNYEIEIDRKKAIKKGINKLKNNDVLLILGKGHEEYQIIDDKVIPFSDKKIVLQSIKKK